MPIRTQSAPAVDPDFAHEVLADLYAYRRKRRLTAWLAWGLLGWLGVHRFYLERPGTGVLQLLTGGGALLWWVADAWLIHAMVDEHNREQERRQGAAEPPVELSFMPPRVDDVLGDPPDWMVRWAERGRGWRAMRLGGDLLVLMVAGLSLGALAGVEGGREAVVAVTALIAVTLLGGRVHSLAGIPGLRALIRWSHRLRLFYYLNRPGSPPGLLFRGVTAGLLAPFRRRDRAEVALYLQLGATFTLIFAAHDIAEDVVLPLLGAGVAALDPARLLAMWLQELLMTFIVTYSFAAPVGAILTLYLLTRRTHTLPRILGLLTLLFIVLGAGVL